MPDLNAVTATFAVYLIGMIAIGVIAYRRTRSLSDYILGGRRLGRWVSAISAEASDMSGWLLLGLPGLAYATGLQAGWTAIGVGIGTWANWRLVAARLRRYTQAAGNSLTLPDFFERRFDDHSRLLRVIAAVIILGFFTVYTVSGLVAGGKLFNAVFDMPYSWAVAAGALVIVVYTFLGGFLAVSWTDLIQGLLMAAALVIAPAIAVFDMGGPGATLETIRGANPTLLDPMTNAATGASLSAIAVLSGLGWAFGYFGLPHVLARFMAIRSIDYVRPATRIAVGWVIVSLIGAVTVGLVGVGYPDIRLTGGDREQVFIELVGLVFHPVVAGVLLAAVLAAIMSTADSQLLVASSALSEDFYKSFLRPNAGDRELVWIGRGAVVVIAAVAYLLAQDPDSRVLGLVAYAWAGFGAAFGPTVVLSLYWRRMTRNGALAGMIAGGATVLIWKPLEGGWIDLYEIWPGVAVSVLAIVIVSALDAPPACALTDTFDRVRDDARRGAPADASPEHELPDH